MRSSGTSQQCMIADQIRLAMQDTPSYPLDELVLSLPRFTWNQVFLEVDRLRRTGQVQVTVLGVGNYAVTLQNKEKRRNRDRQPHGPRGTTKERCRMRCQRCQGFMVAELIEKFQAEWAGQDGSGWRCVICGDIVDPVIAAHRMSSTMLVGRGERLKMSVPRRKHPARSIGGSV